MVDAEFDYTYEYQGNAPKLVHTPLTDKCYLTLTQGKPLTLTNTNTLSRHRQSYSCVGYVQSFHHNILTTEWLTLPPAAMHMGLGGNPYGPAGTGKTESVKALGGLFGRQVLVFNCDEVRVHRVSHILTEHADNTCMYAHILNFAYMC